MGATDITIRKFEAGDADAVSQFIAAALQSGGKADYGEAGAEQRAHLYSPNLLAIYAMSDQIFLAVNGAAISGAGFLSQDQIRGVFVDGGLAAGGIGEQLLRQIEKTAAAAGQKKLAAVAGMQSAEFFKQLGYAQVDESDEFIGDVAVKMFRLEKSLA